MREAYQEELEEFRTRLVELAELAAYTMQRATTALLDADLALAEDVIGTDEAGRARHERLDRHALSLLAQQQPVATDLRTIVGGVRMSVDLERMSVLARHVAELVRRRHPRPVVPESLRSTIVRMGEIARQLAGKAASAIATRNASDAAELDAADDEMDQLTESLTRRLLGDDRYFDIETAIDLASLTRFYERFADHAVSLATQVTFQVGTIRPRDQPGSPIETAATGQTP